MIACISSSQPTGLRQYQFDASNQLTAVAESSTSDAGKSLNWYNAQGQRVFQSEWQYPRTTSTTTTSTTTTNNSTSTSFTNWLLQLLGFIPSSSTNANNANNVLLGQLWNWADNTGGLQGWQLLSETGNGGPTPVPSYNYIWLPLGNSSTTQPAQLVGLFSGESAYPVHTDHLGTPRRINSTTGSTVWQWAYDGYGETQPSGPLTARLNSTGSNTGSAIANSYQTQPSYVQMNLRFAGQYWDERAQLAYNFMRWYSKTGGRYITPDPIGLDAGWNRMAYGNENPVLFTDAYGLDAIFVHYVGYSVAITNDISAPLGHAGAIAVDPATGKTQYYEFGRYGGKCGNVRGPFDVGNVVFDKDGNPTPSSIEAVLKAASVSYGKNSPTYYEYSKKPLLDVIDYAERRKHEAETCERPYKVFTDNCKTFGREATGR